MTLCVTLTSLLPVKQLLLCQYVTSQNVSSSRFWPPRSESCAEVLSRQDTGDLLECFEETYLLCEVGKTAKVSISILSPTEKLLLAVTR